MYPKHFGLLRFQIVKFAIIEARSYTEFPEFVNYQVNELYNK